MRWLITGGCGFIGTNLVRYLCTDCNNFIRILDNLSGGTREDLRTVCEFSEKALSQISEQSVSGTISTVELIVGDIMDTELAYKVTEEMDVIVHLAANTGVPLSVEYPCKDCYTNVIGTLNYLEAARHNGVKRFVFASSNASIGEYSGPVHEELAAHPVSPYGASKLSGEGYCSAYYQTYGVETVALRFGNVYGPGSTHKTSVVAKFIGQAIRGETLEIYGDGTQTRDFVFIDDLVQAIWLAGTVDGIGGEIFQIATGVETTVNEMLNKLLLALKDEGITNTNLCNAEPRRGDVKQNYSNISKVARLLNWRPQTKFSDGLKQTVKWFVESV